MVLSSASMDIWSILGPFVLLYPEIHYLFKYFPFSRYRIREPEMVADAPFRIEPGQDIPVLLLLKDADKYPVFLESAAINLHSGIYTSSVPFEIREQVNGRWWKRIFNLTIPDEWRGQTVEVDVSVFYQSDGRKKEMRNDNCPGLSHAPLKVHLAAEAQPVLDDWIHGDIHFHTEFTDDQVEFGAPVDAAAVMAKAMGMKFFCATDHSYDLDDMEADYLQNDPDLKKWKRSRETIKKLNQRSDNPVVIIPGEEVSCGNAENRNVHCLVLNNDSFLPGSGDSAEKWLCTDAELSISEVIDRASPSALKIAAHPKDPAPFLEKMLIRRGMWSKEDCQNQGISGLQILNGLDNDAFRKGLEQWRSQLLRGERIFIFAGNDAHGNFNRFRQVKIPMLFLHEIENYQPFGWARTCVWMNKLALNVENVVEQLRRGHAVITTGPMVVCAVHNERGEIFQIGETASGDNLKIQLHGKTNKDAGTFTEVKIVAGQRGGNEIVLHNFMTNEMSFEKSFDLPLAPYSYFRCESRTSAKMLCYTNPIWIQAI